MSTPTPGGFSLFPSPSSSKPPRIQTPKPRRSESRERRTQTPQERRTATPQPVSPESARTTPVSPPHQTVRAEPSSSSPPRQRQTPQLRMHIPVQPSQAPIPVAAPAAPASSPPQAHIQRPPQVQRPLPAMNVIAQAEASSSRVQNLVRHESRPERSSIAKLPLRDEADTSEPPLRSIFPTYDPEIPLNQQNYVPTQLSPTRIPRAVINRQSYYEDQPPHSPPAWSPIRSARSIGSNSQWPARPREAPVIPPTCTTEELRSLWKTTNGWRPSPSEGRVYCLKLTQEKDAPVYTLSSDSQPFYNLRLDPTSASAYVTLSRLDPNKPYKAPKPGPAAPNSKITDGKYWQEALTTTTEEESRKHPPNDGLVALLMPTPATRMALDRADDPTAVMTAEREAARLVWDEDSANHFLVHPALATPFCVTIERSPAWSRVEYTLEHHESPHHLAKLTRDGTGAGWLELDTGIAAKIDSYYISDVAVTALMLVAAADEKNTPAVEVFEAPPPPPQLILTGRESKMSKRDGKKDKKKRKMETFEIDVESQNDSLGKSKEKVKELEDGLPFLLRVIVKMIKGLFLFVIWILTIGFKCVAFLFKGCYKCVGSKY